MMTAQDMHQDNGESKSDRTPFLKFYTDDWMAGTIGFTLEQEGFYLRVLTRMWARKAMLPHDVKWLSGALNSDPRTIRRLVAFLLGEGKLTEFWGYLVNPRMVKEIRKHFNQSTSAKDRPKIARRSLGSQAKIGEKKSKITEKSTDAPATENHPYSRSQIQIEKEQDPFSSEAAREKDDHKRIDFSNGKIELFNGLQSFWLEQFEGDAKRLELGLIQAAAFVQPNNPVKPLEAQVGAQLARQCAEKRDRDRRYAKATESNGTAKARAGPADFVSERQRRNREFAKSVGINVE